MKRLLVLLGLLALAWPAFGNNDIHKSGDRGATPGVYVGGSFQGSKTLTSGGFSGEVTTTEQLVTLTTTMGEQIDTKYYWNPGTLRTGVLYVGETGIPFTGWILVNLQHRMAAGSCTDADADGECDSPREWRMRLATDADLDSNCATGTFTAITGSVSNLVFEVPMVWESVTLTGFVENMQPGTCVGVLYQDQTACTPGGGVDECQTGNGLRMNFTTQEVRTFELLTENFTAASYDMSSRSFTAPGGATSAQLMKGGTITNFGAGAGVTVILPECLAGETFTAHVRAAQTLTIDPNINDAMNGIDSGAGDSVSASNIGDSLWCECADPATLGTGTGWYCTNAGFVGS